MSMFKSPASCINCFQVQFDASHIGGTFLKIIGRLVFAALTKASGLQCIV